MHIKTMAIQINENTYPIAAACLGGGFASIPFRNVKGAYLVINAVNVDRRGRIYNYNRTDRTDITLTNHWTPSELFHEEYEFVGPERKTMFTEVIRTGDAPVRDRMPHLFVGTELSDEGDND